MAGCGGGSSPTLADAATPAATCVDLPDRAGLAATRLSTSYVPPDTRRPGGASTGALLPGHCVVTGAINPRVGVDGKNYAIGFQLSLPDQWNGRFLFIGGGGNDGILRDTSLSSSISGATPSPLGQGFAVVSTDAGHTGTTASFGADPQARLDHAYNAYDKTAVAAKSLISTRYGRKPEHSYFSGCSGGGGRAWCSRSAFPTTSTPSQPVPLPCGYRAAPRWPRCGTPSSSTPSRRPTAVAGASSPGPSATRT